MAALVYPRADSFICPNVVHEHYHFQCELWTPKCCKLVYSRQSHGMCHKNITCIVIYQGWKVSKNSSYFVGIKPHLF